MRTEESGYQRVYEPVRFSTGNLVLDGDLMLPEGAHSLVVFAHGSGSSRFSSRNKKVAEILNESKIGALLIDLLSMEEDLVDISRFDIVLLTSRLIGAVEWAESDDRTLGLPVGLFGVSTGAAAALQTGAILGERISAIVSRGGRPDLAGPALSKVTSPTLFIVGGEDRSIMPLNEYAYDLLAASRKRFAIIPGAGHLFDEPGAIEEVSRISSEWFATYL